MKYLIAVGVTALFTASCAPKALEDRTDRELRVAQKEPSEKIESCTALQGSQSGDPPSESEA